MAEHLTPEERARAHACRFVWRALWRRARGGLGVLVRELGGYGHAAARALIERGKRDETESPFRKLAALNRRAKRIEEPRR